MLVAGEPEEAESMASEARDALMISMTIPLQSQQTAIRGPFKMFLGVDLMPEVMLTE